MCECGKPVIGNLCGQRVVPKQVVDELKLLKLHLHVFISGFLINLVKSFIPVVSHVPLLREVFHTELLPVKHSYELVDVV